MSDLPLVTVGITCFNAEATIARALNSALVQDWPHYEIIIVDDLSSDNSVAFIEEAIVNESKVRLVQHEVNQGPAGSRNSILNHANGEFIIFFDDDDEGLPGRIAVQYEALINHEKFNKDKLIACYASGARLYPNGYELEMHAIGSQSDIPVGDEVVDYLLYNSRKKGVFYGAGVPTCALMARVTTFREVGGFDSNFRRVEDVDFAIRLAMLGGHFIGCPNKLFVQHATIASDKSPIMNLKSELQLVDKFSKYLKFRNRYGYARDWFKIRFYHFSGQRLMFFSSLVLFLISYPKSGIAHLMRTLPARWSHENKMKNNVPSIK